MTDDLSPGQLAQALERLEAEKRRREGKPSAPVYTAVERHVLGPETNTIISNPPAPQAKPKRRKTAKSREARLTPVPFFTQTGKPTASDPGGTIAEAWFVVKGKELALCDAAGEPGEWLPIHERGALYTARQALRNRLAARRGTGPDHRPIQYDNRGWR